MVHAVLWLSICAFALSFLDCALAAVYYLRNRAVWFRYFFVYLASMTLFQFFFSFTLFAQFYIQQDLELLFYVFEFFRLIVSVVLLYVMPCFVLLILNRSIVGTRRFLLFIFPGFLLASGAIVIIWELFSAASVVNALFYAYLALFSILAGFNTRELWKERENRIMVVFLLFSALFYLAKTAEHIFFPLQNSQEQDILLRMGAGPLFNFIWAGMFLVYFLCVLTGRIVFNSADISAQLKKQGITDREAEIIRLIAEGMNNRQIGEKLFISPRTVETHIYNIYKKTSVKNRIELTRLYQKMTRPG